MVHSDGGAAGTGKREAAVCSKRDRYMVSAVEGDPGRTFHIKE